jgi:FkbM family methyltransferase
MTLSNFPFRDITRLLQTPNGRKTLAAFVRYGSMPRHTRQTLTFGDYTFTVPDAFSFLYQLKEIFADEFYAFNANAATPGPNPVIFDCGANIGTSVVYFRQQHPTARIVAFEADPVIGQILTENLQKNHIEGVDIIQKAVWTDENGISLGGTESDGGSVFSTEATRPVPSVRLRDWLLREPRIDMLKMDIEGAEIAVLADCADALTNVQAMFVEFHAYFGHQQSLAGLLAVLENSGFRYYIDTSQYRKSPLINHQYRNNAEMDLQLNIFAYRER